MVATLGGEPTAYGKVVLCQTELAPPVPGEVWKRKHHRAVPWVGHLQEAPLLFVSSTPYVHRSHDAFQAPDPRPPLVTFNGASIDDHPSLGRPFEAPKYEWDVWTDPTGTRGYTNEAMGLGDVSPYWSAAYSFASSAFTRPVRPDTTMPSQRLCAASRETSREASTRPRPSVPRYFERTLALSPAAVVVAFGRQARQQLRKLTGYADCGPVSPPLAVAGRERALVFLAHPNSRKSQYAATS